MHWFDLTIGSPEHDLALDEALLDSCEDGDLPALIRFWESPSYFVVLGYANQRILEANVSECAQKGIPVLRRCSGGGTVLQGPGCLNYTLILPEEMNGALSSISGTNKFIMERQKKAVELASGLPIEVQGHTDLVLDGRKFSGNAQRRRRKYLLFHGSFLIRFNLDLIPEFLNMPSAMPDYRKGRSHAEFIMNLPVEPETLKQAIRQTWGVEHYLREPPLERVAKLVQERYGNEEWNFKY